MPSSAATGNATAFLKILNQTANPSSSSDISDNLKRLRRLVLTQGIPEDSVDNPSETGIRARVWKLLLRIDRISVEDYFQWVDMGPSEVSAKSKFRNQGVLPGSDIPSLYSQKRYLSNTCYRPEFQGQGPGGHVDSLTGSVCMEE